MSTLDQDSQTASEALAAFAVARRTNGVPQRVLDAATLCVLDTVGVGIAAAVLPGEATTARAARRVVIDAGGAAEAAVIGADVHIPAAAAALANAALQHSLDFDDIHTGSRLHTSTITVPAALAVAERVGATGREALAAVAVGNEIAARIAMAPPVHFQAKGFHGTPVCGIFGAVTAAAMLFDLSSRATAAAIGIAADVAGGTNAWAVEGTANKHLHAGWAAQNGVLAAQFAAAGAEGPRAALEGRDGFYAAVGGFTEVSSHDVTHALGAPWVTEGISFKAWPSCYWMHGSLEAARRIREELVRTRGRTVLSEIDGIEAIVPSAAVPLVLEPHSVRRRPLTAYAGKFSLQYSVAVMLLQGRVDLGTYTTEAMSEEAPLRLADRVVYRVDDAIGHAGQIYPGGLSVRLTDGSTHTVIVQDPPGSPRLPLGRHGLVEKFRANAAWGLSSQDATELEHRLLGLCAENTVADVSGLLRRVQSQC